MSNSKEKTGAESAKPRRTGIDKHWHMAVNDHEIGLTEFEFALLRLTEAFSRWMDDCSACCDASQTCGGVDFAILNVVRMHDRPKSVSEIGRLLNRVDQANLQYSLRKLAKANLIRKLSTGGSKRGATYAVTEQGGKATDDYVMYRRELLVCFTSAISEGGQQMEQASRILNLMSGLYDQASCLAAAHRITPE